MFLKSVNIFLLVGHALVAVNSLPTNGSVLEDGRNVKDLIENKENYPLTLKFARPKMTTNEKIFLASMFYPLFAIASQLSPEFKSSGIEILESDTFKLHCFQTLTGNMHINSIYIFHCGQNSNVIKTKIIFFISPIPGKY